MRHKEVDSDGKIHETLAIHEVYYKDDLVQDDFVPPDDVGYTEKPVAPVADDLDGLRFVLAEMLNALDKPALDYK